MQVKMQFASPPMPADTALTAREKKCLAFLAPLMEATGPMIGEAIASGRARSPRGYSMIGNPVARFLAARGLVSHVRELNAWAITPAGRTALKDAENAD